MPQRPSPRPDPAHTPTARAPSPRIEDAPIDDRGVVRPRATSAIRPSWPGSSWEGPSLPSTSRPSTSLRLPWPGPSPGLWSPWQRPSVRPSRLSSRRPWVRPWGRLGAALAFADGAVSATTGAGAVSERAVFDSAARALPAAVWAPFALTALPAAIRALAALRAAALPVLLATRPPATTCVPSIAALILITRRDLRRAAAFGWMAPALAARSSAEMASLSEVATSALSGCVAATETALATSVFAADRRGCRIACRRSAWRTRFSPDGVRAPCHFRGVLAKVADLRSVSTRRNRRAGAWTARGATANGSRGVRERPALCPCSANGASCCEGARWVAAAGQLAPPAPAPDSSSASFGAPDGPLATSWARIRPERPVRTQA